jgi:hypothetical protein
MSFAHDFDTTTAAAIEALPLPFTSDEGSARKGLAGKAVIETKK